MKRLAEEKVVSMEEFVENVLLEEIPNNETTSNDDFFFEKGILFLGEINEGTEQLIQDISYLNMKNKELPIEKQLKQIVLKIDSEGGYIALAFKLIEEIRLSEIPIVGIVEGMCASSAVPVFLACHEKIYRKNATFLIHEQSLQFPEYTKYGQLVSYLKYAKESYKKFKEIILENSSLSKEKLKKLLKKPDKFLSVEKAEEIGLLSKCQLQKRN